MCDDESAKHGRSRSAEVLSEPFPINRGVVQGDILSPLYFILALEMILRRHDNVAGKGVDYGGQHYRPSKFRSH